MNSLFLKKYVWAAVATAQILYAMPLFAQNKKPAVKAEITVLKKGYSSTDPLEVRFSLTNISDKTVYVLNWNTPYEGINENIFNVTLKGKAVSYIGKVVKRSQPRSNEYFAVEPGKPVSVTIDMSEAYDMADTGSYSIEYVGRIFDIGNDVPDVLSKKTSFTSFELQSNSVTLNIQEKRKRKGETSSGANKKPGDTTPEFVGCSKSQLKAIQDADKNARSVASDTYDLLKELPEQKKATCDRFSYWFGAYDASRFGKVSSHFASVKSSFSKEKITYNCNCDKNWYAYVYPSTPYEIYLCSAFWNATSSGADSQPGTLIQQMSRFDVVAGSENPEFGKNAAYNFAKADPAGAVENADNHEYFVENTPARTCDAGPVTVSAKQVSALQNGDGSLEIFYIGTDGKIYRSKQAAGSDTWNGSRVQGTAVQLAIEQNQDGRLALFVIGDGQKISYNEETTKGGNWRGFQALGGEAKQIVSASNQDGRLEVFYVGTDNKIYHNWQKKPGGDWSGESRLGGLAKQIDVAKNQDGRLEIFYVGTDDKLYHNWQKVANGDWNGEQALGGSAKQIDVAKNQDGRLEAFYVGTDNKVYHNWQKVANGDWNGAQALGGSAKQIDIIADKEGRLDVFYVGLNNALYHNRQIKPGSVWKGQEDLGGKPTQIVVAMNKAGGLEVFYVGTDGVLYRNRQSSVNGAWSGETAFGK